MAGVNKNFIVKNGLEVGNGLIFTDVANSVVGIASTTLNPAYELHVVGGIGATSLTVTGVTTTAVAIVGSAVTINSSGVGANNLNVSGIVTSSSYYVGTTTVFNTVSGQVTLAGIQTIDSTTKASLERELALSPNEFDDISVTGISTLSGIKITSGIVTAVSGVATYYGDGTNLTGVTAVPAGTINNVQYNNGSVTAGSNNFVFTGTHVGIGTTNPAIAVNASNTSILNVGVVTANFVYGSLTGNVTGNVDSTGVSTFTTLKVGTGVTISGGIVTATSFYGDGANLTNAGATLQAGSGTQNILLTSLTSGIVTSASVDTSTLQWDHNTNTLNTTNIDLTDNLYVTGISSLGVTTATSINVGSAITANSSGLNVTGFVTATTFTNQDGVQIGPFITKDNTLVGNPGIGATIGLGTGLNGNQSAVGIVTLFLDATINDLTNVNASPNTSDVLQWNGTNWVAGDPTSIGSTVWQTITTGAGTTQAYYKDGAVAIGTDTFYGDYALHVTQGIVIHDTSLSFGGGNAVFDATYVPGGSRNFFLGAGNASSTGSENLMYGFRTGLTNTTGSCNVFLGYFVGASNLDGSSNNFIGRLAGAGATNGCSNNFIGNESGGGDGSCNTTIGIRAGYNLYGGSDNNYIGSCAGCGIVVNSTGARNNFIGYHAGRLITSGSDNIAIGSSSGYTNSSGCNNVFVGTLAGYANTTGNYNAYIGYAAGGCNTTGCENVFIGYAAGLNNTTGTNNVYIGRLAGQCSTTTNGNIAIGELSLYKNTKFANIAIGGGAGCNLTGGTNADGAYNVLIGTNSGDALTTGTNNIIIGDRGVDVLTSAQTVSLKGFTTECHRISIGNVCTTNFYTKMAAKSWACTTVKWDSTSYELAADTSSCRFKTNIEPFLGGVGEILKLNSVKYNPIENPDGHYEIGLIAEQVAEAGLTEIVAFDADNQPLSVSYDRMAALFINAIKELHQENQQLKNEISLIKKHLDL